MVQTKPSFPPLVCCQAAAHQQLCGCGHHWRGLPYSCLCVVARDVMTQRNFIITSMILEAKCEPCLSASSSTATITQATHQPASKPGKSSLAHVHLTARPSTHIHCTSRSAAAIAPGHVQAALTDRVTPSMWHHRSWAQPRPTESVMQ